MALISSVGNRKRACFDLYAQFLPTEYYSPIIQIGPKWVVIGVHFIDRLYLHFDINILRLVRYKSWCWPALTLFKNTQFQQGCWLFRESIQSTMSHCRFIWKILLSNRSLFNSNANFIFKHEKETLFRSNTPWSFQQNLSEGSCFRSQLVKVNIRGGNRSWPPLYVDKRGYVFSDAQPIYHRTSG